jgi:hypothetical protein
MKFGIFYEHQLPRPWNDGDEHRLFQEALDQVELADQTVFIQQGGRNKHEHICEALELFAKEVMPEFRQREIAREKRKREELAPHVEKAMARKQAMKPMRDEEIPVFVALGRKVAEEGTGTERQKQNAKLWADAAKVTLSDPLRHNPKASVK